MNELMRRRRALLAAQAAESEWAPLVATWVQGQINADGQIVNNHKFVQRTGYIAARPGAQIRNDGPTTGRSDKPVTMWVHEYNGTTWLRRTYAGHNGDTVVTIGDDTTQIRLTFAYGSTSGMTMTQSDIDTYAKPMIKRR